MLWDGLNPSPLIMWWTRGYVECVMIFFLRVLYMNDYCVYVVGHLINIHINVEWWLRDIVWHGNAYMDVNDSKQWELLELFIVD